MDYPFLCSQRKLNQVIFQLSRSSRASLSESLVLIMLLLLLSYSSSTPLVNHIFMTCAVIVVSVIPVVIFIIMTLAAVISHVKLASV